MSLRYAHGAVQWLAADAATTTYPVSGLGFVPKALRFYCCGLQSATDAVSEAVSLRRGVGFAASTSSRRAVGSFSQDTPTAANCGTVACDDAVLCTTDGAGARDGLLDLSSIDSDGFTLVVDDATPANLTVFWEAWGGSDIRAVTIGDIAEPAATGTQNYTADRFEASSNGDQVVMFAGVQSVAAVNTAEANDSGMCVGFLTGAGEQCVVAGNSDDASGTMDTDGYCSGSRCLAMVVIAGGTTHARAAFSAFGAGTFTLDWEARLTTNRRSIYMAIKGGNWRAGGYTIDGSTGSATATVSGLPFAPIGISLIGRMTTEQTTTNTAQDRMSLGSGTSTTSRRSMGVLDEDATLVAEIDTTIQYDQVLCYPSTTGTLLSAYDINAMNSDGFQIIVDVAGGVASEWQGYLAFASGNLRASDGVSLNDDQFIGRQRGKFMQEASAVSLYDSNVQLTHGRRMGDSLGVTDGFSLTITGGGGGPTVFTVTLSDSAALADGLLVSRFRNHHFVDAISIDDAGVQRIIDIVYSDSTGPITDVHNLSRQRGRVMPDGVTLTDAQYLSRLRGRVQQDGVAVTDEIQAYRLFFRLLTDAVSLLDGFISSVFGGTVFQITLSDVVAVADQILYHRHRNRRLDDAAQPTDESLVACYRNRGPFTDSVTLTDGAAVSRERLRHLSESLTITDAQLHFLLRTIQASDAVAVTDGSLLFRLRSRDLIDALAVTDSVTAALIGPIAPVTVEVRIRLGAREDVLLGQHDPVRLGHSDDILLGGYN